MANLERFEKSLDAMVQLLMEMKRSLNDNDQTVITKVQSQPEVVPNVAPAPPVTPTPSVEDEFSTFEQLKKALHSDRWPAAVNRNLICDPDSDEDKTERARGIIELMIEEDLKGLKFLDFGCGEGHCAVMANEYKPAMSVGYDIKQNEKWETFPQSETLNFTTDFEKVSAAGPFDVILIFDVLDHAEVESPSLILAKAKSVLKENGKIYLRTHPFTSRHATHFYHSLNKAYCHLVFTPEELAQLVPSPRHHETINAHVVYPLRTYSKWIDDGGLKIINRREITEKPEPFFKIPKIAERIIMNTKMDQYPEFQMGMQFIDLILQ